MKLENQVCTLEQAKKLKELGIIQHSLCCYMGYGKELLGDEKPSLNNFYQADLSSFGWVSAFTVAELGVLLGEFLNYETFVDNTYTASVNKVQIPHPSIKEGNNWFCIKSDKSEAEVRAEMLINLLGHKLLEVEACNKRLLA